MDISLINNSALRVAIQRNLVSFPAQIPALAKRPGRDTQERMALLYFTLGWTVRSLCDRYCLSKAMVQKLLSEWRIRAVGAGYIQEIHPDELESILHIKDETDPLFHAQAAKPIDAAPLPPPVIRDIPAHASM